MSGVQILLRAKRAEKFGGVPPHMTFWGYNNCKETYGAYRTALAQVDNLRCRMPGGGLEFPGDSPGLCVE